MQDLGYTITRSETSVKQNARPSTPKYERVYNNKMPTPQYNNQSNPKRRLIPQHERSYRFESREYETKEDLFDFDRKESTSGSNSFSQSFFTNILMNDQTYEVLDLPKKPRLIGVTRPPSGYFYITPEEYLTQTNKNGKRSPLNQRLVQRWIKVRDAKPAYELSKKESMVIGRHHDRCKSRTRPGSLEGSVADIPSICIESPVAADLFEDENDSNIYSTQKNIMKEGKTSLSPKFRVKYFPSTRKSIDIKKDVSITEKLKIQFKLDKERTNQKYEKLLKPTLVACAENEAKSKLKIKAVPQTPISLLQSIASSPKNTKTQEEAETLTPHTPEKKFAKGYEIDKSPFQSVQTPSTQRPPSISIEVDNPELSIETNKMINAQIYSAKVQAQNKSDRLQSFLKRRKRTGMKILQLSQLQRFPTVTSNSTVKTVTTKLQNHETESIKIEYDTKTTFTKESEFRQTEARERNDDDDFLDVKRCNIPVRVEDIKPIN